MVRIIEKVYYTSPQRLDPIKIDPRDSSGGSLWQNHPSYAHTHTHTRPPTDSWTKVGLKGCDLRPYGKMLFPSYGDSHGKPRNVTLCDFSMHLPAFVRVCLRLGHCLWLAHPRGIRLSDGCEPPRPNGGKTQRADDKATLIKVEKLSIVNLMATSCFARIVASRLVVWFFLSLPYRQKNKRSTNLSWNTNYNPRRFFPLTTIETLSEKCPQAFGSKNADLLTCFCSVYWIEGQNCYILILYCIYISLSSNHRGSVHFVFNIILLSHRIKWWNTPTVTHTHAQKTV